MQVLAAASVLAHTVTSLPVDYLTHSPDFGAVHSTAPRCKAANLTVFCPEDRAADVVALSTGKSSY
jgi:hypothetical protein